MFDNQPTILALDFDGVICDGLLEYFATTKKTYGLIWQQEDVSEDFAPSFYKLRPVIETGWEMPILLRALVLGIGEGEILDNWSEIAHKIITDEQLAKKTVVGKLDGVRDSWIEKDLEEWLSLHRFYPGTIGKLQQAIDSPTELYIVTTKEGRFVKRLLKREGIELPAANIIGKESKRPKYETLRLLKKAATGNKIVLWFVEDRIKALQQVSQQTDLQDVKLFLADWGYNIERDRNLAKSDRQIDLLSLEQFAENFSQW